MKLEHLTLTKLVDAAYFCGLNRTPIFLIIASDPGCGKSWSTESLKETPFVLFINKVMSPQEHRKKLGDAATKIRLLLNDDIGLCARWNAKEYFATFIMCADGGLGFKQMKNLVVENTNFSIVLCCTSTYFIQNKDDMAGMGLFDRLIPVCLKLSEESRIVYQEAALNSVNGRHPPKRNPLIRDIKNNFDIRSRNLNPRLILNIKNISKYLTAEETEELINVTEHEFEYEV